MKGIRIYSSGDYAGIDVDDLHFYYGYEVTEDTDDEYGTEEWCFQVKDKEKVVFKKTTTQLAEVDTDIEYPVEYLLAGIALWIRENKKK